MATRRSDPGVPFGLCFALTLGVATSVSAEPIRADLIVTRGPNADDCPDGPGIAGVVRAVAQDHVLLAPSEEPRTDAEPVDTWITVELSRDLTGYRAVIAARGRRQGTRTLADVGPTCGNIAAAVAITLVVLLDPEVPRALEVPPPVEARPTPLPESPLPSAPPPIFRPAAEVHGGASFGVLEHPAALIEGGGRLGIARRFSLAGGGGFVFPDRFPSAGGDIQLSLAYAYLRGGVWLLEADGEGRLGVVVGSLAGSLAGDARGFEHHAAHHLFFGTALAGGEFFATLAPHVGWSARALLALPYVHDGFSVVAADGTSASFRVPTVGAFVTTGLTATF